MGGSALGSTAAPLAAGAASSGGKGGGQTAQTAAPTPTQGQYSPMTPTGGQFAPDPQMQQRMQLSPQQISQMQSQDNMAARSEQRAIDQLRAQNPNDFAPQELAPGRSAFRTLPITPTQGQYSPMPRPAAPNVYQQSASALTGAQNTAGRLANFTPTNMQAAGAGPTATYGGATVAPATTYGGATVAPATTYGGATVAPATTYGGATVAPTATMSAAQLGQANTMQGVGQVSDISGPGQINVDQLRTMDISQYMNPYTQNVIETGQADIERQRQMASNTLGAQAQAAGAFGGSRQAVQEGVLAGEALRQAGQLSAQQRQAGFGQALQSGQFDINQMQAARTLESQQTMQASTLNQQAEEAAAAREQAARAGNMQAANAFAVQQAQFEQQARSANQAAENARSAQQANLTQTAGLTGAAAQNAVAAQQAGLTQTAGLTGAAAQNAVAAQQAGLTQAAGLTGAAAQNAVAAQQAGLTQAAGISNQAAINQAVQAQASRQQAANQANYGGQFTAAGVQAGAAGQLGNLSQTGFNMGQQIGQQQMQQGLMQQGLQQALIDAARGQYQGFTGAPQQSLGLPLAALGATPNQSTTTQSRSPGLFDYLSLGASIAAAPMTGGGSIAGNLFKSDIRLKTNIKHLGKEKGHNVYSWDWNEDGKRIADPKQPTVGVMAQELQETHPHLVELGPDGFLRVDYSGLAAEAA